MIKYILSFIVLQICIYPQYDLALNPLVIKTNKISQVKIFNEYASSIYRFNEKGKIINYKKFTSKGLIYQESKYFYNLNDTMNKIKVYTYLNPSTGLILSSYILFKYDLNNNLQEKDIYTIVGFTSIIEKKIIYYYNNSYLLTKREEINYYGFKNKKSKKHTYYYNYNDKNILISIITYDVFGNEEKSSFEYTSKNEIKKKIYYYASDNTTREIIEYKYDNKGLILEEWETHYSDNKPRLLYKYYYTKGDFKNE